MKKMLIANWKSNKTEEEVAAWLQEFGASAVLQQDISVSVVLAPAAPFLPMVAAFCQEHSQISVAAQDVSRFPLGSYTGAVAAAQLASLGVSSVIVGHSERRRYFGETNQFVAQKVDLLLEAGITPVVCIEEEGIQSQVELISAQHREKCIVAYEPLSAIGTGMGEDIPQVQKVVAEVKTAFGDVAVIYGGSVDERNLPEYLLASDGVLVGGGSLDVKEFIQLLTEANASKSEPRAK
ncbi:triosephosphate isomerase [Candidatus Woesebacteria bacterium]|nr:triosephosphate isomerase [Candidatus Woesebacteria bacterium]